MNATPIPAARRYEWWGILRDAISLHTVRLWLERHGIDPASVRGDQGWMELDSERYQIRYWAYCREGGDAHFQEDCPVRRHFPTTGEYPCSVVGFMQLEAPPMALPEFLEKYEVRSR